MTSLELIVKRKNKKPHSNFGGAFCLSGEVRQIAKHEENELGN